MIHKLNLSGIVILVIGLLLIMTGCGDAARIIDCIDGCSMKQGPVGPQGERGPEGTPGERGPEGAPGVDGEDAAFVAIGRLGVYKQVSDYTGDQDNQLTCMLGQTNQLGRAVLRLRSAVGGLIEFKRVGYGKELVLMPPQSELFIYTKFSGGTFKSIVQGKVNTKACF